MDHPVRIILKKVRTDGHGELIDTDYVTIDIDNENIESLLFNSSGISSNQYRVVGAELLNISKLREECDSDRDAIPF